MYPEGLEMSNIITIMNEDLSFNINDFIKLKEIQKLYPEKPNLVKVNLCLYILGSRISRLY